MLHSSATLTADDVSIRCRIRRSPLASQPTFDEALEMTCTLRHWEVKKRDPLACALQGSMYSSSPLRASPPNLPVVSHYGENNSTYHECAVDHRLDEEDSKSILHPDDDCHDHGRHSEIGRNTIVDMKSMKNMNNGVDSAEVGGPELLLTALSNTYPSPPRNGRDDSPTQRRGLNNSGRRVAPVQYPQSKLTKQPLQCRIPLTDIMVVDTYNARFAATSSIMHVTTLSSGLFEFDCFHCNGHDLLLAFLQASLPPERILDGGAPRRSLHQRAGQNTHHNSEGGRSALLRYCSSNSVLDDVDALTERHLKTTMERETLSDKLSRRFRKVVVSLTEISAALCEGAVCCHQPSALESVASSSSGGHVRSHHSSLMMQDVSEQRDMPERASDGIRTEASALQEAIAQLELAPDGASISNVHSPSPHPPINVDDTADTSTRTTTTADVTGVKMPNSCNHRNLLEVEENFCKLPSGLSIEPDPDQHSTRSYSPQ